MQVSNSTRQNARYRILSGGQVVEQSLEPYSYARHEVEPGDSPMVEFLFMDSTFRVRAMDPGDEVLLVEVRGGECEVKVLAPKEPSDAVQPYSMQKLIEAMLPATVPTPPAVLQARRNALAREKLFHEFGALTSVEVADLAGSRASNKAALANRWKQEGRISSVLHNGGAYYPAFQFDADGRPLPVIAEVIRILGREVSDWELALWYMAANGWLGGRRPVDLLASEPDAVVKAAEREAEGFVF